MEEQPTNQQTSLNKVTSHHAHVPPQAAQSIPPTYQPTLRRSDLRWIPKDHSLQRDGKATNQAISRNSPTWERVLTSWDRECAKRLM
jgi:hypothetical protein